MRSDDCSVYHLRRGPVVSKIRKRDQPEVARALRFLGMSEVEEMLYEGTVFVEGEDDVELMEEAFPESLARIKFKDLSGRGEVEKQIKRLQKAELEGQKENISYFLFDHDRKRTNLTDTQKVRVKQWDRYCIENYLLEPEILFDVISNERRKLSHQLRGRSSSSFKRLIHRQLQYQTATEIYLAHDYAPPWDNDIARDVASADHLQAIAEVLLKRLEQMRAQLTRGDGKWKEEFVGKCEKLLVEREPVWLRTWQTNCNGKRFFRDLYAECGLATDPLGLKRRLLKECKYRRAEGWNELESTFRSLVSDSIAPTPSGS